MKNTKTFKLLVMVLSIMLLVGTAVAVSISAEETTDTYGIEYINISHKDAIVVLVAVDAPVADAANIEVKYTIGNGEEKIATYWGEEEIDGVTYPTFYTIGIPMKDMGETIKAEAHKVGTAPASPEYVDISVANYLYSKLYKDGYITATEGEDLGRKNLYKNLLSYGAQAQEVLWNNRHPDDIRPLVTDIIPVYVEGDANVAGNTGLIKLNGAGYLDLAYTGTDLLVGWKVTDENGANIFYNNVYVSEGAKVSPVTTAAETLLTFDEACAEDTTGLYNKLTFTDSGVVVSASGSTNTGVNGVIGKATVKTDAAGNKYLNIVSPGRGGASTDRGHGLQTEVAEVLTDDANVTVLSFDMRGTGASGAIQLVIRPSASIYAQFNSVCDVAFTGSEEWTNFRLEYYDEQDVVQLYVNGVYQKNLENASISELGSDIYACINGYNDSAFDIDIDNLALYKTTKTYASFPYTALQSGTVCDFESETAGVLGTNPDFTNYTFAGSPLYVKANGSTKACSAGAEIIEENGNKYFYMYAGKRVNTTDRGWSFNNQSKAEALVPEAFANFGVLELDMKFDDLLYVDGANQASGNGMINWSFYFGDKYVRFDPTVSGTDIKLAGYTFMTFNAWYTVRLEFNADDNTIDVYSKLRGADEWTRSFTIPADATPYTGTSMSNISAGVFKGFDITGGNSGQMYSLSFDNVSCYSTRK